MKPLRLIRQVKLHMLENKQVDSSEYPDRNDERLCIHYLTSENALARIRTKAFSDVKEAYCLLLMAVTSLLVIPRNL